MWLGKEWQHKFEEKASCYVDQYNNSDLLLYEGDKILTTTLKANGARTLHENIADNQGLKIALRVTVLLFKT
ncbi:hypothetical protein ANCCEY_14342 [Ancylostoma ceylanicum]|uniref:Peptidase M13 C-terminal domain-containing protein n=1 Tax=Ancylostoma ceylanicum TaxID=53326 RepID=A0A0D6LA16_9BILA|nr:hypothetical protein ANCCEY_14342 [Ancylostoma ceylanicum]